MRCTAVLLLVTTLSLLSIVCTQPVNVQFNLVYPIVEQVESVIIVVKPSSTSQEESFPMITSTASYNVTHEYTFSYPPGVTTDFEYRYIVYYKNGTSVAEDFWRILKDCRLQSSNSTTLVTMNEFFGQTETNLGVPPVPNIAGIEITPPEYFDDDQVVTASFYISQADLDAVIFNPNDEGEIYVKANLTLAALKSLQVFEGMKIRRAGGISLRKSPYSYQIKLKANGPAGEDTVIKFKAYPLDYDSDSAFIVAEKTCADICYSVGAPINFVSYSRVFINGIYQGLYGMVEKVDENFVQRRWPYVDSGNSVGSLYKVQSSYTFILGQTGFHNGFDSFSATQSADNSTCCPCYENGCDVNDGCDIFDDNDQICPTLDCCSCSWEKNGKFDAENANCAVQKPFYDFITLGNAILGQNLTEIDLILDAESYARSLICSLAVMNHDGYAYSGYNYYWYRDPVSAQFKLILYDQDATLTNNRYTYSTDWTPYDWTFVGDLSDAPFLSTILQLNSTLNSYYTNLFSNFLEDYYRSDETGSLFDRMNIYSTFIQKYNSRRVDVLAPTETFIKYFITPLSAKLQQQLSVTQNPVTVPPQPFCNSTAPYN